MSQIQVVNIKCGGCEKSILAALQKAGLKNVKIDAPRQTIFFEGDEAFAKTKLTAMGYPEVGSAQAKSLLKKVRSYISCAVGRVKKIN